MARAPRPPSRGSSPREPEAVSKPAVLHGGTEGARSRNGWQTMPSGGAVARCGIHVDDMRKTARYEASGGGGGFAGRNASMESVTMVPSSWIQ